MPSMASGSRICGSTPSGRRDAALRVATTRSMRRAGFARAAREACTPQIQDGPPASASNSRRGNGLIGRERSAWSGGVPCGGFEWGGRLTMLAHLKTRRRRQPSEARVGGGASPPTPRLRRTSFSRYASEGWWKGLDSNQRTLARADLQSAAINHSATLPAGARLLAGKFGGGKEGLCAGPSCADPASTKSSSAANQPDVAGIAQW